MEYITGIFLAVLICFFSPFVSMFGKEPRVANSKRLLLNIICSEMFFIISFNDLLRKRTEAESNAEVDCNLTLCPFQSRLHPNTFTMGNPACQSRPPNPMPELTLSPRSGTSDLASDRVIF
jgi:hypothetical protein